MPTNTEMLTIRQAATILQRTPRHIRRLADAGRLRSEGTGPARRISRESVETYAKKVDIRADISSTMSSSSSKTGDAMRVLNSIPPLSEPAEVARQLGIPPGKFDQMIDSRVVPVVAIGGANFVPQHWFKRVLSEALGVPVSQVELLKGGAR